MGLAAATDAVLAHSFSTNAEMFLFFFMILVQEDAESRAFPAVGNQPFREPSV